MSTGSKNLKPVASSYIFTHGEGLLALAKSGTLTINEIRALIGFSPINGGDKFPVVPGEKASKK